MLSFLKRLVLLATLIVLAAAGGVVWWVQQPVSLAVSPLEVVIKPNSSVISVGKQLANAGAGVQPQLFPLVARATDNAKSLKAGGYALETGTTPTSTLDKMAHGGVTHYVVTVVEGWSMRQMRAVAGAEPALKHDTAGLSDADLMCRIGASEANPKGLFFPDICLFAWGSSDMELYRRAYQTMQRRLNNAWVKRSVDLPYETPYEALTMASIIEKETGQKLERPMIAAVFVNRLRKNMLLQTDPTVIYGLGTGFDGNLRKRDLQADTPYNTHTRTGLPPTPIALSGMASLRAALNPVSSDALYFVARGDGSSQFSTDLTDHNRAINKYQRGQP